MKKNLIIIAIVLLGIAAFELLFYLGTSMLLPAGMTTLSTSAVNGSEYDAAAFRTAREMVQVMRITTWVLEVSLIALTLLHFAASAINKHE